MANIINTINNILKPNDIENVVKEIIKHKNITTKSWKIIRSEVLPASNGLTGFLGDHYKISVVIKLDSVTFNVFLFVKSLPLINEAKAEFIDNSNYYRREMIMFKLFEDLGGDEGSNPWRPKAYLCNERLLVMPDLTLEGYITKDKTTPLDLHHVLLATAAIAKYHAALTNYETKRNANDNNSLFFEEHKEFFAEPSFYDSPWIHAGANLVKEYLSEFSLNFQDIDEARFSKAFVNTCNSLKEYEGTLNLILHRDLWNNNIMFRYKDNEAINAILLDFQCIRYGPPAFDVMGFLYLNTSSKMREQNEILILKEYFSLFWSTLDGDSRSRMLRYGYDFDNFIMWCEKSRGFGMLIATAIFPYVMMEGVEAGRVFDNPETFDVVNNVSRSKPVIAHARDNVVFRDRLLETFEETVTLLLKLK